MVRMGRGSVSGLFGEVEVRGGWTLSRAGGGGKGGKGFRVKGGWWLLGVVVLLSAHFGLVKAGSMFSGGLSVVFRSERVGEEEDWRGGILDKENWTGNKG